MKISGGINAKLAQLGLPVTESDLLRLGEFRTPVVEFVTACWFVSSVGVDSVLLHALPGYRNVLVLPLAA